MSATIEELLVNSWLPEIKKRKYGWAGDWYSQGEAGRRNPKKWNR